MAHFGDGEPYFGGGIGAAGTSSLTDLISSLWGSSEPDPTTTQLPYQAPAGLLSILQNFKQPIAPPVTIDTKRPDPAANVDRIEYYTPATPVRTIRTNIPDPVKQTDGVRHETEHNIPATLPRKNVRPATGGSTANSGQREPPPPSFKEVTTGMRFRKLKPSEESNQREFDISKMKADPPTTDLERSNINGDVAREDLGRSSSNGDSTKLNRRSFPPSKDRSAPPYHSSATAGKRRSFETDRGMRPRSQRARHHSDAERGKSTNAGRGRSPPDSYRQDRRSPPARANHTHAAAGQSSSGHRRDSAERSETVPSNHTNSESRRNPRGAHPERQHLIPSSPPLRPGKREYRNKSSDALAEMSSASGIGLRKDVRRGLDARDAAPRGSDRSVLPPPRRRQSRSPDRRPSSGQTTGIFVVERGGRVVRPRPYQQRPHRYDGRLKNRGRDASGGSVAASTKDAPPQEITWRFLNDESPTAGRSVTSSTQDQSHQDSSHRPMNNKSYPPGHSATASSDDVSPLDTPDRSGNSEQRTSGHSVASSAKDRALQEASRCIANNASHNCGHSTEPMEEVNSHHQDMHSQLWKNEHHASGHFVTAKTKDPPSQEFPRRSVNDESHASGRSAATSTPNQSRQDSSDLIVNNDPCALGSLGHSAIASTAKDHSDQDTPDRSGNSEQRTSGHSVASSAKDRAPQEASRRIANNSSCTSRHLVTPSGEAPSPPASDPIVKIEPRRTPLPALTISAENCSGQADSFPAVKLEPLTPHDEAAMDIPQVAPQSVSELPSQPVFNGTVKDEPQTSVHAQPAENGQDESDDALYSMSMHERLKLEKRRAAQNAEKSFSLTASATVTKEEFPAPNTRKRKKAPAGKAVKKRKVEKPAEDNDIYIVESIISVRSEGDPIVTGQPLLGKSALLMVHPGDLQSDNIKKRYLVHWEGYGDAGRTWEPEEHLSSAKLMLKEFWKRRVAARKKVGAAMRLVCALARWRVRVRKK